MKQYNKGGLSLKLGIIAALAGACGVMLARTMELRPFRQTDNSSLLVQEKIIGLIPGTLNRPINILVLGVDNSGHGPRDKFNPLHSFVGNSDTMLLLHISNKEEISILSIPRDTRVELPGVGMAKINAANIRGGIPMAVRTVSQLLNGISIDRYVRIDTQGLIKLVDALGGVEINVPKKMKYTDQTQHLYIDFKPGKQVLNGKNLQEYVRFRDKSGDIGRVERQQEVLSILTKTIAQPTTLLKIPQIYSVAKTYLDTDLSLGEILTVINLAFHNKRENLKTILLPGKPSGNEYRLSYWIADRQKINQIISSFGQSSNDQNSKEWSIAVINSTKRLKLAANTVAFLKAQGLESAYVAPYQEKTPPYPVTQIFVKEEDLEKAKYIKQLLGRGEIKANLKGETKAQVTLILGED